MDRQSTPYAVTQAATIFPIGGKSTTRAGAALPGHLMVARLLAVVERVTPERAVPVVAPNSNSKRGEGEMRKGGIEPTTKCRGKGSGST